MLKWLGKCESHRFRRFTHLRRRKTQTERHLSPHSLRHRTLLLIEPGQGGLTAITTRRNRKRMLRQRHHEAAKSPRPTGSAYPARSGQLRDRRRDPIPPRSQLCYGGCRAACVRVGGCIWQCSRPSILPQAETHSGRHQSEPAVRGYTGWSEDLESSSSAQARLDRVIVWPSWELGCDGSQAGRCASSVVPIERGR